MAAVAILVWMPVLNRDADLPLAPLLAVGVVLSLIYGLMFAKLFHALEPDPPRAQVENLDPEFRSGRHHKLR